jgi:hypothetical protein
VITIDSLREQLIGRRVAAVRGRDEAGAAELSELVMDDGTVLRFSWWVGSADQYVGLRVGPARAEPLTRSTRRI